MNILSTKYDTLIGQPFREKIEELNRHARIAKESFLADDLSELKQNSFEDFILLISSYYRALCFYPDAEIVARFKHWGISKTYLKWMIPLQVILDEFNKIESNGKIIVLKQVALGCIQQHLATKILHEMLCWGDFASEKVKDNKLHQEFTNQFKKRSYKFKAAGLTTNKTENSVQIINKEKQLKNAFLKKTQGKTEYMFLKLLLEKSFIKEGLSDTQFYCGVYDLFRLLCIEEKLPDEAGFYKIPDIATKSWDRYRYLSLKKLIYKQ